MSHPDEQREAGFYWISIQGQEAEVAQWQLEWDQWFVIGSERPLSDEIAAYVTVLSGPLLPPALPTDNLSGVGRQPVMQADTGTHPATQR